MDQPPEKKLKVCWRCTNHGGFRFGGTERSGTGKRISIEHMAALPLSPSFSYFYIRDISQSSSHPSAMLDRFSHTLSQRRPPGPCQLQHRIDRDAIRYRHSILHLLWTHTALT